MPYKGSWLTGGPQLQIEFSRISNNGRLTLVIDLNDGELVPTRFVESTRTTLSDAIDDLRAREGSPTDKAIGYVDIVKNERSNTQYPDHAAVFDDVADWCGQATFDAVVWTALPPNFQDKRGVAFSVNNAVSYLQGLTPPAQKTALDYIRNAPTEVDTPFRRKAKATGLI